jgi:hypothetical protein
MIYPVKPGDEKNKRYMKKPIRPGLGLDGSLVKFWQK